MTALNVVPVDDAVLEQLLRRLDFGISASEDGRDIEGSLKLPEA